MTFRNFFSLSLTVLALSTAQADSPALNCFPDTLGERPLVAAFVGQGLSKEQFDRVLDRVSETYQPIFQRQQQSLRIVRLWENPKVNAGAIPNGNHPAERLVYMFGGLARHENITEDAFTLAACHEVGHHLGGAPLYVKPVEVTDDFENVVMQWHASNEGQSDYYATTKCARKVFENDDNVAIVRNMNVPSVVQEACGRTFRQAGENALCQRSAMAGIALGKILSGPSGRTPDLSQPDLRVVTITYDQHPPGQCRADTYFQGAACHVSHLQPVSRQNPESGVCTRRQGDQFGLRPLCWYAPEAPVLLSSLQNSLH